MIQLLSLLWRRGGPSLLCPGLIPIMSRQLAGFVIRTADFGLKLPPNPVGGLPVLVQFPDWNAGVSIPGGSSQTRRRRNRVRIFLFCNEKHTRRIPPLWHNEEVLRCQLPIPT